MQFLFLLVLWPAVFAVIAYAGGWQSLASSYRALAPPSGRTYGWQSLSISALGSYNNAIDVTVGDDGVSLQPVLPFRFMHPLLTIPWSAVAGCESRRVWFSDAYVLTLQDGRAITFYRNSGQAVLDHWGDSGGRGAR